jgi:hypothetical protein
MDLFIKKGSVILGCILPFFGFPHYLKICDLISQFLSLNLEKPFYCNQQSSPTLEFVDTDVKKKVYSKRQKYNFRTTKSQRNRSDSEDWRKPKTYFDKATSGDVRGPIGNLPVKKPIKTVKMNRSGDVRGPIGNLPVKKPIKTVKMNTSGDVRGPIGNLPVKKPIKTVKMNRSGDVRGPIGKLSVKKPIKTVKMNRSIMNNNKNQSYRQRGDQCNWRVRNPVNMEGSNSPNWRRRTRSVSMF